MFIIFDLSLTISTHCLQITHSTSVCFYNVLFGELCAFVVALQGGWKTIAKYILLLHTGQQKMPGTLFNNTFSLND